MLDKASIKIFCIQTCILLALKLTATILHSLKPMLKKLLNNYVICNALKSFPIQYICISKLIVKMITCVINALQVLVYCNIYCWENNVIQLGLDNI